LTQNRFRLSHTDFLSVLSGLPQRSSAIKIFFPPGHLDPTPFSCQPSSP
jgi:hypothetical protein